MNDPLQTSLLARYRNRTLGHFYILNSESQEYAIDWAKQFCLSILEDHQADLDRNKRRLSQGHPDILWLAPQDEIYKIENKDFDPLFQAMAHKPLELPWKFIFVEKPQTIGTSYANKLLKTLEEPTEACTIFFLSTGSRPLLSTIESRAIKLRLLEEKNDQSPVPKIEEALHDFLQRWMNHFPDLFEADNQLPTSLPALASEMALLCKGKGQIEATLVRGLLTWSVHNIQSPEVMDSLLTASKHQQKAKIFNSSINERIFSLVTSITAV